MPRAKFNYIGLIVKIQKCHHNGGWKNSVGIQLVLQCLCFYGRFLFLLPDEPISSVITVGGIDQTGRTSQIIFKNY